MKSIEAKIKSVKYVPTMCKQLNKIEVSNLDDFKNFFQDNANFILNYEDEKYALSKWVSPKRTRSYPRARVYDTYQHKNRITIIPLVKDEGKDGDRDYLQFDTISLMSLLQVYVIIGYYHSAEKKEGYDNKITNQKFDFEYIKEQIEDLINFQSDALHWNIKQLSQLESVSEKVEKGYYEKIAEETEVEMHSKSYFKNRMSDINQDVEDFKKLSRSLSEEAQNREVVTLQPKESLSNNDKATVTIKNYLGGEYYLTTDEHKIINNDLFLIEKKHTSKKIPSLNDIKNGVVLMILFTNLSETYLDEKEYTPRPVIGITGNSFKGYCSNNPNIEDNVDIKLTKNDQSKIDNIFNEANQNGFDVYICEANNDKLENDLLQKIHESYK